jgi:hypothetical protein
VRVLFLCAKHLVVAAKVAGRATTLSPQNSPWAAMGQGRAFRIRGRARAMGKALHWLWPAKSQWAQWRAIAIDWHATARPCRPASVDGYHVAGAESDPGQPVGTDTAQKTRWLALLSSRSCGPWAPAMPLPILELRHPSTTQEPRRLRPSHLPIGPGQGTLEALICFCLFCRKHRLVQSQGNISSNHIAIKRTREDT